MMQKWRWYQKGAIERLTRLLEEAEESRKKQGRDFAYGYLKVGVEQTIDRLRTGRITPEKEAKKLKKEAGD